MANPWFRMYSEFAHDPKVQMMPEVMQRRYIMIMCMRCSNGLVTLHETEIAFHLRISNEDLAETKELFIEKGFIDEEWNLLNWEKRQFASDSSAARVAKHRASKKQQGNGDVTLPKRPSNALDTDTDTDTEELHGAPAPVASDADNPPAEPAPADPLPCPVKKIVDAYHTAMPDNPRIKLLDDGRRRTITARWKQAAKERVGPFGYSTADEGVEAWKTFFTVCSESDFLTGKTEAGPGRTKPFVADLDFLLSPKGFKGCLENKYHRGVE